MNRRTILGCLGLSVLSSCTPGPTASGHQGFDPAHPPAGVTFAAGLPADQVVLAETVYVPIYSSVATADNARAINLAATLTIRNLDQTRRIEVRAARYHDSGGQLIRDHLPGPIQLAPLAAVNLFVGESDVSGGASPSFLVEWVADGDVTAPLVEAVMISTAGAQGISFTSVGRVIASHRRPHE